MPFVDDDCIMAPEPYAAIELRLKLSRSHCIVLMSQPNLSRQTFCAKELCLVSCQIRLLFNDTRMRLGVLGWRGSSWVEQETSRDARAERVKLPALPRPRCHPWKKYYIPRSCGAWCIACLTRVVKCFDRVSIFLFLTSKPLRHGVRESAQPLEVYRVI